MVLWAIRLFQKVSTILENSVKIAYKIIEKKQEFLCTPNSMLFKWRSWSFRDNSDLWWNLVHHPEIKFRSHALDGITDNLLKDQHAINSLILLQYVCKQNKTCNSQELIWFRQHDIAHLHITHLMLQSIKKMGWRLCHTILIAQIFSIGYLEEGDVPSWMHLIHSKIEKFPELASTL